jgi:hypothetical protein
MDTPWTGFVLVGQHSFFENSSAWANKVSFEGFGRHAAHLFSFYSPFDFVFQYIYFLAWVKKYLFTISENLQPI